MVPKCSARSGIGAPFFCIRAFGVASSDKQLAQDVDYSDTPTHCGLAFAGPHLNDAVICSSSRLISVD